MNFNQDKFIQLVHFICDECRSEPSKLGAVKLNKILWLTDVFAYRNWCEPVTGETYRKQEYGPVASHLRDAISSLEREGKIYIPKGREQYETTQYVSKKRVEASLFNEKELRLIKDVITHVTEDHTAGSISDRTHDQIWKMALMNEVIPYEAVLVANLAEITQEDIEWAQSECS